MYGHGIWCGISKETIYCKIIPREMSLQCLHDGVSAPQLIGPWVIWNFRWVIFKLISVIDGWDILWNWPQMIVIGPKMIDHYTCYIFYLSYFSIINTIFQIISYLPPFSMNFVDHPAPSFLVTNLMMSSSALSLPHADTLAMLRHWIRARKMVSTVGTILGSGRQRLEF